MPAQAGRTLLPGVVKWPVEIGTVLTFYGPTCEVLAGTDVVPCRLRGKMRLDAEGLATGDRVEFRRLDGGAGLVERVLPRKNELVRPIRDRKRRRSARRQVVLANAEQVVVVAAARQPGIDFATVDRALALARAAGLRPVLCVGKIDLADPVEIREMLKPYDAVAARVHLVSALTGEGLPDLAATLEGRLSLFWGRSGVGKSSLIQALTGTKIKTGIWDDSNPRGPHTTNVIRLYPLPGGGLIADSPGFDWLELDEEILEARETLPRVLLPEAATLPEDCDYANCSHSGEPGCAVIPAVLGGEIDPGRFSRYCLTLAELRPRESEPPSVYVSDESILAPPVSGRGEDWLHVTLGELMLRPESSQAMAEALGAEEEWSEVSAWAVLAREEEEVQAEHPVHFLGKLTRCSLGMQWPEPAEVLLIRFGGTVAALGSVVSSEPAPLRWRLRKALRASPLPEIPALWTDLPNDATDGRAALIRLSVRWRFQDLPQILFGLLQRQDQWLTLDLLEIDSSEDTGRKK